MIDFLNTPSSNSVEFKNEYQRCAKTGIWTALSRDQGDTPGRVHRRIYIDGNTYHTVYNATRILRVNPKHYFSTPLDYTEKLDKFSSIHQNRAGKDALCFRDMKILGYNTPNIVHHFTSSSLTQKLVRDQQLPHKRKLDLKQEFFSTVSTEKVVGQTMIEMMHDPKIPYEKKKTLVKDFYNYALVLGISMGDADALRPENTVVADMDQDRPKAFYTFDKEYAFVCDTDMVLQRAKHVLPQLYNDIDWALIAKGLFEFHQKILDNLAQLSPYKMLYAQNISDAFSYIKEGKYKDVEASYTPEEIARSIVFKPE